MRMQSSDQDQRSLGIEDTSMTIEFLRARLLSERSVSKSARQRADELAERVAELEEQLRIVSLQRKKAEKATADVLAILETHGISDVSDSYYSSSDQEMTPRGHKARGSAAKKAEGSVNSRERERELEKFSGSDLESSLAPSRRLSWKGRRDPSLSTEKFKDSLVKRSSSFASVSSSSKHRLGKSCRQIKRREQRSEATECGVDCSVKADSQINGGESETGVEISRVDSRLQEEKESLETAVSSPLTDEFGAERDMERALEQQAQLIGRYRDMEKEQREWEEKYRENNSSTAESCDPGNHSDITEEREEINSQSPYPHPRATMPPQDPKPCIKLTPTCNGSSKTPVTDCFLEISRGDEEARLRVEGGLTSSPLHDPTDQKSMPLISDCPRKQGGPEKNSAQGPVTSSKQTESYALVPHQTSDQVGVLLDTLQRAKSLLQKEITRVPVPPVGFGRDAKAIEPSFCDPGPDSKVDIPGLFRLPTDFTPEAVRGNYPFFSSSSGMASKPSLTGYFPGNGALLTSNDRFGSDRYSESRPTSLPMDDRYLTNQFMVSASRTVPPNLISDPHFTSTMYTTYPEYPSYPDLVPRPPASNGGYNTRLDTNRASAAPRSVSDHFHFKGDVSGPKMMYR